MFFCLVSQQDGAACCIIASEDFVHAHNLENQAIEIVGNALGTDSPVTFEERSAMELVGFSMNRVYADAVFAQAGFKQGEGRDQVAVVELHDCFAANEVREPAVGFHALFPLIFMPDTANNLRCAEVMSARPGAQDGRES